MKLDTLGNKIGFGYVAILLIFLAAMSITFWELGEIDILTDDIKEVRSPSTQASLRMLNGVNHSLAALRGWIILGKDEFKDERNKAWKDEIEKSLAQIEKLSKRWDHSGNIKRLEIIKKDIVHLKKYQKEIEDISHTINNTPANKILLEQAAPQAAILMTQITKMIDVENGLPGNTTRKNLLGIMADVRDTTGLGLANIRAYLLTGKEKFKNNFNILWKKNTRRFKDLTNSRNLLNYAQKKALKSFSTARKTFNSLPPEMFKIRESKKWNIASYWLETKAAPFAFELKTILNEVVISQDKLMEEDFHQNHDLEQTLGILLIILFVIGAIAAIFVSIRSTKSVTAPIGEVLNAIRAVASGDYGQKIKTSKIKEIEFLGEGISKMQKNLIDLTNGLKQEKEKLLEEDWLKSSFASVTEKLQGHKDLQSFATELVNNLVPKLDSQVGIFYARDNVSLDDNVDSATEREMTISLLGSYAYTERKNNSNHLHLGEGLVGQCALEKKTIFLTNVPEDYIHINSGLGEAKPKNIMVTPVLFENNLMGVLEIGSFDSFTKSHQMLLEQVASNIGVIMNSIIGTLHTEKLLKKSQIMGEELKAQQEELRATNEELEEKANALKTSEEELKAQTEELQASNEELEEKTEHLEKRKEEIEFTKIQVEEKARDLELASKYKSEFLANMSHELRTPLNSLLILAKTLASNSEGNLTDEQVEELKIIHGGGKDLLTLINDILDLSKVEAGKLEARIEDEKVVQILTSLEKQFTPIAKDKGVEFIVNKDGDFPVTVSTDKMRAEQIIKNLLSNAFKFTEKGTVELRVHHANNVQFRDKNLDSSQMMAFSVIDSGIGIPKDKQAIIFEAFQQQDGSTVRQYGGTGLGLAISRELSKLLGGEIHIESEEGQGSTFTLYLPVKYSKPNVTEIPQKNTSFQSSLKVVPSLSPEKRPNNILFGNENSAPSMADAREFLPDDRKDIGEGDKVILIVEDDKNFAKILRNLAQKKGYKCLVSGNGHSGLNLATQYTPTGIILDIELPIIDGLTVLDQLKFDLRTRHIPVHVISAKDENIESLRKGAIGYLSKPAEPEELCELFSKIETLDGVEIKKVLVVEDDKNNQKAIGKLIKRDNVQISFSGTGKNALKKIDDNHFDCIILDLGLPDMSGVDLLQQLERGKALNHTPVIIYTGQDITKEQYNKLSKYTDSIVIKGANSPERLLDETSLFLHRIESSLPEEQKKIIQTQHNADEFLKGKKILVVDDDMRNTYALSKVLKACGLEVTMAENGKIALDIMQKENEIDLVLMDIMMPVMDGFEAIKKLREMDAYKSLPIITLTAKAMREDREKCFAVGANDYLTKPVDTDKLISLIRVWISGAANRKYQLKAS